MNTMNDGDSVVVRVKEAAPLLRVSEKTLIRAIQRGDIEGLRLGRLYFVSRAALERLAQSSASGLGARHK